MPVPMAASAAAAMASQPRLATAVTTPAPGTAEPTDKNFRFYDNRQKYLLFVNTCSEKWVVAERVALELANLHPHPPGLRIFDAGVGDGTVLTRVMRSMHERFPTVPSYIVGKEISLEDVRLTLEKMPDRFYEHPCDGAGPHQHVLFRGTVAHTEFGDRRDQPRLARAEPAREHGCGVREADHRSAGLPGAELARQGLEDQRQSDLREAGRAGPLSRGLQIPARSACGRSAARRAPITTSSSLRSPIAPAPRPSSRRRRWWRRWHAPWARAGG